MVSHVILHNVNMTQRGLVGWWLERFENILDVSVTRLTRIMSVACFTMDG